MKAMLIKSDGTTVAVSPSNGTDFALSEVQKLVGGYVELVRIGPGRIMLINEDGLSLGLPTNAKASKLFPPKIVGDVVTCDGSMFR